MATPSGAVAFTVGADQHELRFGINALCRIEDKLGMNVVELGEKMGKGLDVRTLRAVFACGLGAEVSDERAGDLMDGLGIARAGVLVGEAFQAAFPSEVGEAKSRPRKAAAGTGSTS